MSNRGSGNLTKLDRVRLVRAFDQLVPAIPTRPLAAVMEELTAVREARRTGGRETPADKHR